MKSRVVLIFAVFAMAWSLLLLRVFVLQMFPHQRLERLEAKQYETTVKIEGRRGSIYDRNGTILAMSAPAYSLYADPQLLWEERASVAKKLQKALGLNVRETLGLLKDKNKRFVWVERQLSPSTVEKIKALKIRGLGFIEEPRRVYPDEDILKPILGVVGQSGNGLEGIEKQYNSILRGNPKKVQVRRDARGRPLQINGLLVTEVEDGSDVHLTIDRELQYVLHRELARTVQEQGAAGAVGVILDAQTSEVRAMDAVGEPMGAVAKERETWRNRPILEAFEPGSTMKTFIAAAGLQMRKWQPNTRFNCEGGKLKIGRRVIGEADSHHKFGWLTISEILAFSSNIGVTKMAFELGEVPVKQYLSMFGFGRKTGIDLPGEAKGIIQGGNWSQHLLSNVSFGHGLAVTPIQIANAYAAIANGGILRVPRVTKSPTSMVSSWEFPWGQPQQDNSERNDVVRVLSESEAQTMRLLLAGVTAPGGTGVSAVVPGYPVAGKTGTAQKVNPNSRGYLPGEYISSFAGMIPANEPRFVIYVAIDSPKKQYYGSQVAGPLFSQLATFAVRHEGLAPRWLNENQAQGLLPRFASKKSQEKAPVNSSTAGDTPIGESLSAQKKIGVAQAVGPNKDVPVVEPVVGLMPDLEGLTLREVQERLQNHELRVNLHGSGKVIRFHPEEGAPFKENDIIDIWLSL